MNLMAQNSVLGFLPLGQTKTRIMATVEAADHSCARLAAMLDAGASIFRIDATHVNDGRFASGDGTDVSNVLHDLKGLSEERRQPIVTFLDLAGPSARVERVLSFKAKPTDAPPAFELTDDFGFISTAETHLDGDPAFSGAVATEMPDHPAIGDTVLVYARGVAYSEDPDVLDSLASVDPREDHDFDGLNTLADIPAFAGAIAAASHDPMWRLQTDISSFLTVGDRISLGNGQCTLTVEHRTPGIAACSVAQVAPEFRFRRNQHINPGGYIFDDVITSKDVADISWAVANEVDAIALSSACSPLDAFHARKLMHEARPDVHRDRLPLVFAKFEAVFAVSPDEAKRYMAQTALGAVSTYSEKVLPEDRDRYLSLLGAYTEEPAEAICDAFDGAVVARGDLAVDANRYLVPFYQQRIIDACRLRRKPAVVATGVLMSMQDGGPASGPEIGDIATAVMQQADVIMLSGAFAHTGTDAARVIAELRTVIEAAEVECVAGYTEQDLRQLQATLERQLDARAGSSADERAKIGMGGKACAAARATSASAMLTAATTGETARYIASFRPLQSVIAITDDQRVARRLVMARGVYPVLMRHPVKPELDDFIQAAREINAEMKIPAWQTSADGQRFVVPAVLHVRSNAAFGSGRHVPNTVHELSLPTDWSAMERRELEYVLTEHSHRVLKNHLYQNADTTETEHLNHYLADPDGILSRYETMVRIRRERTPGAERVLLTVKREARGDGTGSAARTEHEFDVTPYELFDGDTLNVSRLPLFHRRFIWSQLAPAFRPAGVTEPSALELFPVARMLNRKCTSTMECGLTLDLDEFTVGDRTYHQLAIETAAHDDRKRDEFVHLLFGALDIPFATDAEYPSQLALTSFAAGLEQLEEANARAVHRVELTLERTHRHRRRFARVQRFDKIHVMRDGESVEGEIVDISRGGALVRTPRPFPPGSDVTVRMSMPEREEMITACGRVTRVPSADLEGISFSQREISENEDLGELLRAIGASGQVQ
jgi:pyruvate kinase